MVIEPSLTCGSQGPEPDVGGTVVSEVEVPHDEFGVATATSWWQVESGLIVRGREYWITPAGEEPPAWRARYTERYDGRFS